MVKNELKYSVCLTSKSNEHYTPLTFLVRVYEFLGGEIDLDPCSSSLSTPTVFAHCHYVLEMDGLILPWWGKVFVNPPYGRNLEQWTAKIVAEYRDRRIDEAIYLVPSRTDTKWTKQLNNFPRCYLYQRLKFDDENRVEQESAPFPSVVFYFGKRVREFQTYWEPLGNVMLPARLERKTFDKTTYQREYMRSRRLAAKSGN